MNHTAEAAAGPHLSPLPPLTLQAFIANPSWVLSTDVAELVDGMGLGPDTQIKQCTLSILPAAPPPCYPSMGGVIGVLTVTFTDPPAPQGPHLIFGSPQLGEAGSWGQDEDTGRHTRPL